MQNTYNQNNSMKKIAASCLMMAAVSLFSILNAQNPCIHHLYTADPAPVVYEGNDSLYVYCDIDEGGSFYTMNEWRVYSTIDMVNWTDHGSALPLKEFSWGGANTAWASQCCKKGNYYYWYVCCQKGTDWRHGIGVARSNKPSGPFKDIIKKPLIWSGEGGDIDPTVFIDDDGTAYLYYGNNKCRYAILGTNMMSIKAGPITVELTKEAFGGVKDGDRINGVDAYEEGPWLSKRNGKYYLSYAAGGVPEHISYSMADSPRGPWHYVGQIMRQQDTGSFTNHSGVVDYKGNSYFVYHTGWLPGGGGYTRSFAIEKFKYNADGTIPSLTATRNGVAALCNMNPFERQQAETMNEGIGIAVEGNEQTGVYVTKIGNDDYIKVRNLAFGTSGARSMAIRYASNASGSLVVRTGSKTGKVVGRLKLDSTSGKWTEISSNLLSVVKSKQDIFFTFAGLSDQANLKFDWWEFAEVTTGIDGIEAEDNVKNTSTYNLSGIQVPEDTKGIVIRNGKKFVNK